MSILSSVIENDQMERILAEFTRLDDRVYLENAGATLYPQCLLKYINKDLMENVYMNPHTDKFTKDCVDHVRNMVLKYFNTNPSEYTVIFTSGATQSLRTIIESFNFASDDTDRCGSFAYLRDNHTSVLGLRELIEGNTNVIHISHDEFLSAVQKPKKISRGKNRSGRNSLFVYPAENNFNGFKYPMNVMDNIRNGCLDCFARQNLCEINSNWYILLDVASYAPTNKLDLSQVKPDFICLSFYKVFGYPSGLGALIVKNSNEFILSRKKYFGGGTVDFVLSSEDFHVKKTTLQDRFEDGTVPFLSIIGLKHCFDVMEKIIPKTIDDNIMQTISYHTFHLAKDLYMNLRALKHPNGNKATVLYMDSDFSDITAQGGIVTFNLLRDNGTYIGYVEFQHMADLFNINVRTGCFCNSGSCQRHLRVTNKNMKNAYKAGHKCGDEIDLIDGKPTGAIRVSFGYFNTYNDVDKLLAMICRCFVKTTLKKQNRVPFMKNKAFLEQTNLKMKLNGFNNFVKENQVLNDLQSNTKIKIKSSPATIDPKIVLTEVAIFPVKSCGAFKVSRHWKLGSKGLEYDREWMIITDNGVCLTQKQNSRMCLIRPIIDLSKRIMILTLKNKNSIKIPLDPLPDNKKMEASFCRSRVCADNILGEDCGDAVANWISEALEVSFLRLVRQSSSDNRKQKKKGDQGNSLLSLSNQAQYLLINKATVRWLQSKIQDETFTDSLSKLVERFRGNLIIDMDEPLVEKQWQKVIIGSHEFKVEGQCSRCQMVCIDQATGEKTVEPLRTISSQFAGKLQFGIYLSYIGNVDVADNNTITLYSSVTPLFDDENVSR